MFLFLTFILAKDYIYLLDKPEENDRKTETERNGTVKSFSNTISDDSSTTMENKKVSHRPIPSYRERCFTVRFGRDGAAVESGVKCTGEIGKKQVFLYLRQNNTF